MRKCWILLLAALAVSNGFAAAEVIERNFDDAPAVTTTTEPGSDPDLLLEMRASINELQSEIQELRGRIEVQEHLASAAKKDDLIKYSNDEYDLYRKSYDLIKDKQYIAAEKQLQNYLKQYPTGKYVKNANYWLGRLNKIKTDFHS